MRKIITLLFTTIVIVIFTSCDGDDVTGSIDDSVSQQAIVWADHNLYYFDRYGDDIPVENTSIYGVLVDDPLPQFNYFRVADTLFGGIEYSDYYPGYISFGFSEGLNEARILSDFELLDIEVSTANGNLYGSITLPNRISDLTLNVDERMQLGDSLTISWSDVDADFYSVGFEYSWSDEDGERRWTFFSEFVTDSSITFSGSIFSHSGMLYSMGVQPINGPLPVEGAIGNMNGDGSGFLYYTERNTEYDGAIIVGPRNLSSHDVDPPVAMTKRELDHRTKARIESIILGNQ